MSTHIPPLVFPSIKTSALDYEQLQKNKEARANFQLPSNTLVQIFSTKPTAFSKFFRGDSVSENSDNGSLLSTQALGGPPMATTERVATETAAAAASPRAGLPVEQQQPQQSNSEDGLDSSRQQQQPPPLTRLQQFKRDFEAGRKDRGPWKSLAAQLFTKLNNNANDTENTLTPHYHNIISEPLEAIADLCGGSLHCQSGRKITLHSSSTAIKSDNAVYLYDRNRKMKIGKRQQNLVFVPMNMEIKGSEDIGSAKCQEDEVQLQHIGKIVNHNNSYFWTKNCNSLGIVDPITENPHRTFKWYGRSFEVQYLGSNIRCAEQAYLPVMLLSALLDTNQVNDRDLSQALKAFLASVQRVGILALVYAFCFTWDMFESGPISSQSVAAAVSPSETAEPQAEPSSSPSPDEPSSPSSESIISFQDTMPIITSPFKSGIAIPVTNDTETQVKAAAAEQQPQDSTLTVLTPTPEQDQAQPQSASIKKRKQQSVADDSTGSGKDENMLRAKKKRRLEDFTALKALMELSNKLNSLDLNSQAILEFLAMYTCGDSQLVHDLERFRDELKCLPEETGKSKEDDAARLTRLDRLDTLFRAICPNVMLLFGLSFQDGPQTLFALLNQYKAVSRAAAESALQSILVPHCLAFEYLGNGVNQYFMPIAADIKNKIFAPQYVGSYTGPRKKCSLEATLSFGTASDDDIKDAAKEIKQTRTLLDNTLSRVYMETYQVHKVIAGEEPISADDDKASVAIPARGVDILSQHFRVKPEGFSVLFRLAEEPSIVTKHDSADIRQEIEIMNLLQGSKTRLSWVTERSPVVPEVVQCVNNHTYKMKYAGIPLSSIKIDVSTPEGRLIFIRRTVEVAHKATFMTKKKGCHNPDIKPPNMLVHNWADTVNSALVFIDPMTGMSTLGYMSPEELAKKGVVAGIFSTLWHCGSSLSHVLLGNNFDLSKLIITLEEAAGNVETVYRILRSRGLTKTTPTERLDLSKLLKQGCDMHKLLPMEDRRMQVIVNALEEMLCLKPSNRAGQCLRALFAEVDMKFDY